MGRPAAVAYVEARNVLAHLKTGKVGPRFGVAIQRSRTGGRAEAERARGVRRVIGSSTDASNPAAASELVRGGISRLSDEGARLGLESCVEGRKCRKNRVLRGGREHAEI